MFIENEYFLTEREFDVLECLVEGLNNVEIAFRLHISENTSKAHVKNILTKLNTSNRTSAAVFAVRKGWF